jgi:hypothetical protein
LLTRSIARNEPSNIRSHNSVVKMYGFTSWNFLAFFKLKKNFFLFEWVNIIYI